MHTPSPDQGSGHHVATGWALGSLLFGLAGRYPGFGEFTAGANSVWFFLAAAGITTVSVSLGVNRGIEAFSFGEAYWSQIIRFALLVEEGMIDPEGLHLFQYLVQEHTNVQKHAHGDKKETREESRKSRMLPRA